MQIVHYEHMSCGLGKMNPRGGMCFEYNTQHGKCFNIAGSCFPDEHYMLPTLERLLPETGGACNSKKAI